MNAKPASQQHRSAPARSEGKAAWLSKGGVGWLLIGAILFGCAGRLDWVMGWVFMSTFAALTVIPIFVVDPGLLAERATRRKEQVGWDKPLFRAYYVLSALFAFAVPGLDERFGWSPGLPLWLQLGALGLYALAWGLNIWAMSVNRFFSNVVRIQEERGHRVITDGPYRYVRHPGYTGGILFEFTRPLVLGSVWGLVVGGLAALLLLLRTVLEDRTLHEELPGYAEYARQVRHRLLPGIW